MFLGVPSEVQILGVYFPPLALFSLWLLFAGLIGLVFIAP